LFPIPATKDELLAKIPDPVKAGLRAANSRSVQVSRKTPNRLKPICTPPKAGLDWYTHNFFYFAISPSLTASW
jgi:hypothetical protein